MLDRLRHLALGLALLAGGLLVHSPASAAEPLRRTANQSPQTRPILQVWTSDSCGPCRQLWHDYYSDKNFKDAIDRVYLVQIVNADQHPIAAFFNGTLNCIPAFVCAHWNLRFCGYTGKQQLLCRLGLLQPVGTPISPAGSAAVAPATQGGSLPDPAAAGDGPVSQSVPPTYAPRATPGPSIADVAKQLDGLEPILADIQKAIAAAGTSRASGSIDPRVVNAVRSINTKLQSLDELKATLEGIKANVPAPVAEAIGPAVEKALGKLAPALAPELAKALPAAGAILPAVEGALPLFGPWGAAAAAAIAVVSGLGGWLVPKLFGTKATAAPSNPGDILADLQKLISAFTKNAAAGGSAIAPQPLTAQTVQTVATDSPAPPQLVTTKTAVVPVQVDVTSGVYAQTLQEMTRKYPDSTNVLMTFDAMFKQFLAASQPR